MKRALFLVMTAFACSASLAQAKSLARYEYAQMDQVDFDENIGFGDDSAVLVTVDYMEKTLELAIDPASHCAPDRVCAAVLPPRYTVKLAITDESTSCGSRVLRAVGTSETGAYQQITLQDNRTRQCRDLRPGVEVTYVTKPSLGPVLSHSEFSSQAPLSVRIADEVAPVIERSELEEINVDKKLISHAVGSARLEVNQTANTVRLDIVYGPCASRDPNAIRCRAADLLKEIELPVVNTQLDGCGTTVITAFLDERTSDGLLQKIVVRDNRTRKCRDLRPGVEVELKTEGGEFPVKTRSTFSGPALQ